jgi:hypothetical protein
VGVFVYICVCVFVCVCVCVRKRESLCAAPSYRVFVLTPYCVNLCGLFYGVQNSAR